MSEDYCLKYAVMCPVCSMPAEHWRHVTSASLASCYRASLIHHDDASQTEFYHHNYTMGGALMPRAAEGEA